MRPFSNHWKFPPMRTCWWLLLLVAGLARAEVFPLRSGGAVTGELDRVERGRLVIRTAAGFSTYAPAELPRAWTDIHWQRIGLRPPPVRGASFRDTWRGVFRAETWLEAVSYLRADRPSAAAGGLVLVLVGLWFSFFGGCLAPWRGWLCGLAFLLFIGGLAGGERLAGRLGAGDLGGTLHPGGWMLAHLFILGLLTLPPGSGRRGRRLRDWPADEIRRRLAGSTIVRLALFGTLVTAQGVWVIAAAHLGLGEAQVGASWIAALAAAGVVSVVGVVVQGGRWARREGASLWRA